MSAYTKTTDFAIKDGLASGNPSKVIKGTEHDTEYNNIATAVNSKADTASPTLTGVPAAPTAVVDTNTTQLATTAYVVAAALNSFGSRGLVGNVNSGTPLTKYDLSADTVILKNSVNNIVVRNSVSAITCDLGLAGSAANGRDQAAAFTASSWIHLYFIWNGTTLATLASLTAPPTGPTLPSGYTYWCYATALRWNASSNIIPCFTKQNSVFYDLALGGVNRLVNLGQATTMTAINCASFAPPNSPMAIMSFEISITHSVVNANFSLSYRPTGSTISGIEATVVRATGVTSSDDARNNFTTPFGTSNQIDYKISSVPDTLGGAIVEILGFLLPNGAI